MKSAFPFGGRSKVGISAIIEQACACGKYRVERKAGPLQRDGPEKSNVEISAAPGAEVRDIQRLYCIECAKHAPAICRVLQLPLDPSRQDGLVVPIVHDQNGPPGKTGRE